LILKKKARRRLVGAIALVLLMAILLPVLLKDRAALTEKNDVKITIDNQVEQSMRDDAPVEIAEDFDSSVTSTDDSVVTSQATVVHNKADESTIEKSGSAEEKKPSTELKPKVEPSVAGGVKNELSQNTFSVQVGVFSDAENVKKLQATLTELGYKSKAEKISTTKGEKIRLRTYAFSSKNEAVIALKNIKDAGLTGMVVSQ